MPGLGPCSQLTSCKSPIAASVFQLSVEVLFDFIYDKTIFHKIINSTGNQESVIFSS